jgi:hypothetical protein
MRQAIAPVLDDTSISSGKRRLLAELWDGYRTAEDLKHDLWDFASELESLLSAQISASDVRWAVAMGLIEHRLEKESGAGRRTVRPANDLRFCHGSCFALAPAGVQLCNRLEGGELRLDVPHPPAEPNSRRAPVTAPVWDGERRTLRVGRDIVKVFRVPASNQELILQTFEELGWPRYIDDPLPPAHGLDPKRRLHDAINCLNRNQRKPLIKFRGDGSGQRVGWNHCHQTATTLTTDRL